MKRKKRSQQRRGPNRGSRGTDARDGSNQTDATHDATRDATSDVLDPLASLCQRLDELWTQGWHPADVDRALRKSKIERRIFHDALTLNRQGWHESAAPLWPEQADQLGATSIWWNDASSYLAQLQERSNIEHQAASGALASLTLILDILVPQPLFEAPPSEPGWDTNKPKGNDGVLAKVRALLAKAESTEFEHEAEAYSAKAQELIARHSIDVALLADVYDVPGGRRVYIDDPYAKPKFILLDGIAKANGCRCVWGKAMNTATLVGHQSDMLLTELLFTSLLLQGTGAVLAAGAKQKRDGSAATKSWRNAFWFGFAGRIHERLKEATATARQQHQDEQGSDFLPVLAKRSEAVEQAMSEAFPRLGTMRTSVSNLEGMDAGRSFANSADLRSDRHVSSKPRPALGR